jgi:uncharacterized protein YjbJ (UPF0337 family)
MRCPCGNPGIDRHITRFPLAQFAADPMCNSAQNNCLPVSTLVSGLKQALDCIYPRHPKGNLMNKDQIKVQAKKVAGKVQEATGKLVDSTSQEVKGIKLQAEGWIQQGYGDAKEVVKDWRDTQTEVAKSHS